MSADDPLTYPFVTPAMGAVTSVAAGLDWVRMPLPFRLGHINLWVLRDTRGAVLVDTGLGDAPTRAIWRRVLGDRPPAQVIVTHFHPDHMGNAGWFEQIGGGRPSMTEPEFLWAHFARNGDPTVESARRAAFHRAHGRSSEDAGRQRDRVGWYPACVPELPSGFDRLVDGMELRLAGRAWRVILVHGHAPAQALLHCPDLGVLIAGDQVLPRITPNVGVHWPEPDDDPLTAFLTGLDRLAGLPADTLVLPSHGLPFQGLATRLADLRRHHGDRLAAMATAIARAPSTAAEMLPVLFDRPLDDHDMVFAMAEAVAHANHLWRTGRARRIIDAAGVVRFAAP